MSKAKLIVFVVLVDLYVFWMVYKHGWLGAAVTTAMLAVLWYAKRIHEGGRSE